MPKFHGPGPPLRAAPHWYIFLLYEQLEGFDSKKYTQEDGEEVGMLARVRYDLYGFEKAEGLGAAVAVNHFKSN